MAYVNEQGDCDKLIQWTSKWQVRWDEGTLVVDLRLTEIVNHPAYRARIALISLLDCKKHMFKEGGGKCIHCGAEDWQVYARQRIADEASAAKIKAEGG